MKKIFFVFFFMTSCITVDDPSLAFAISSNSAQLVSAALTNASLGLLPGVIYKKVSIPLAYVQSEAEDSVDVKIVKKDKSFNVEIREGKGCARSILGIVAMGDGSIETAKRQGNITKATSVSTDITSILGVYAESCTVVSGY
jgi:hypothetical protein